MVNIILLWFIESVESAIININSLILSHKLLMIVAQTCNVDIIFKNINFNKWKLGIYESSLIFFDSIEILGWFNIQKMNSERILDS